MDELRNDIITVIFDAWTDGVFPGTKPDYPEEDAAFELIVDYFEADDPGKLFAEQVLSEAMCTIEEQAFKAGFHLCLELLNGNAFQK